MQTHTHAHKQMHVCKHTHTHSQRDHFVEGEEEEVGDKGEEPEQTAYEEAEPRRGEKGTAEQKGNKG